MVNVKAGQTIRVNIAVWDFCGETGNNAIYISDVGINIIPALDPVVSCQDITGLAIDFRFVTAGNISCKGCNPDVVYSTWGTAYTNSQGYAYIDHTITEDDLAAYQAAVASGKSVKVLACITGAKGQQILNHSCSLPLTVLTAASPTHILEFKLLENASGIFETLKSYSTMLTAAINSLVPVEAGWTVYSTEVDTSKGILRLQLSPSGSWGILDYAAFLLTIIITAIGALLLAIFLPVGIIGIAIIAASVIVLDFIVYKIIDYSVELQQQVTNLKVKDQNDTKLDQTLGAVFEEYERSAKTKDDCLNKLNGIRISYTTYMDTMQKNFPNLYTPAMKRAFQSNADNAIAQLRDDKITCERATEIVMASGATAKADVSTNFTANYNTTLGYTPPKKDCWISGPIGEDCLLSASTGKWIVGGTVALIGLGIAYWAVTRKPAETKIVFERAKELAIKGGELAKAEYERMKSAYSTARAPAVPATARVLIRALPPSGA